MAPIADAFAPLLPQLDVRTPAEITAMATPMRAPLDALLLDMSSSLAGRDRLLHERADELVSVRDQLQRVVQDARQQRRQSTQAIDESGTQQRGLERQLFETKAEAAELSRKLRAAQAELNEQRRQLEIQQTLDKVLYDRDAQIEELRSDRRRLEEEVQEARQSAEKSARTERERSIQAVGVFLCVLSGEFLVRDSDRFCACVVFLPAD